GVGGQHHDPGTRLVRADPRRCPYRVAAGHPQVHQHHVGRVRGDQRDRFVTVARRTDHGHVVEQIEQEGEPFPYRRLVVGHHDPDHVGILTPTCQPPSRGPAVHSPPASCARSRSPVSPYPPPVGARPPSPPGPLTTASSTSPGR